jgi:NitT/TauT family transport system permease protein
VTRVFHAIWPPVLFGAVFLLIWEAMVQIGDVKPFLLPAPSAIWTAFVERAGDVWDSSFQTGMNALVGLILGVVLGVAMSFVMMRFRILDELVTPLAVALNAIPIIVIVPVLNNMLSPTTEIPRRLMVMIIVYFIVVVNVTKGLRQVSPVHLELMRSYAASKTQILVKTRIPNAVPYLFTALKISAPLAVITAFVSEYFGGRQNGLAYSITSSINGSKDVMWAYVVGACALGLIFYLASVGLERLATPQGPSTGRSTTEAPASRGSVPGGAATS